jgi:hypothetical protein
MILLLQQQWSWQFKVQFGVKYHLIVVVGY